MTRGTEEPVEVWIGLGSNLADRRANLEGALAALDVLEEIHVSRVSAWIETQPVGGPPGQGPYLNGVACLETRLGAEALLDAMQAVETRFGRQRSVADGPRTLDLDLLTYGEEQIDEKGLIVPHPRMEERVFVLEPLAQLVPEMRLPRSGVTVRERVVALRECLACENPSAGENPAACP